MVEETYEYITVPKRAVVVLGGGAHASARLFMLFTLRGAWLSRQWSGSALEKTAVDKKLLIAHQGMLEEHCEVTT